MLAETEINLVNGLAALALGFGLLVLVAWVDRRYLQRYEDVRSAEEEHQHRAAKPLLDEAVTDEHVALLPSNDVRVVALASGDGAMTTTDAKAGTTKARTAKSEPAKSEPAKSEPVKNEPVKNELTKAGPAKTGQTRSEPAKSEPAESEPTKAGQRTSPAAKAEQTKPVQTKPVQTKPVQSTTRPTKVQPTKSEQTKAETQPTKNEQTKAETQPTKNEQAKREQAVPEQAAPAEGAAEGAGAGESSGPKPVIAAKVAAPVAEPADDPAAPIDLRSAAGARSAASAKNGGAALPKGAEAALASILEVVPDPRNTIALTQDPTAEVRLTTPDRVPERAAITSSGQPAAEYEPPSPDDREWETPKEPAAHERQAAATKLPARRA